MPNRAFTLLELAIVLIILSLITGFGLKVLQTDNGTCYTQTEQQLQAIARARQNYPTSKSLFPKPAAMAHGSNHTLYGVEETVGGILPSDAAYATTIPTGIVENSGVLIGALPVATL